MAFLIPFSALFWVCYVCCGLSDFLDGFIARKFKQQSAAGAKLDSIADIIFAVAIGVVAVINIRIPKWMWLCILCIAALRIFGYGIGFYKYRTFVSLHTYLNKAAGVTIFACPLLYATFGLTVTGIFLCVVSFVASLEEVVIIAKSKELNRDCKGLFFSI